MCTAVNRRHFSTLLRDRPSVTCGSILQPGAHLPPHRLTVKRHCCVLHQGCARPGILLRAGQRKNLAGWARVNVCMAGRKSAKAKVRNIITSWTQGQMISFFFPPLRWNWGFNSLSWNPQSALLRYAAQVLSISVGRGEHQSLLCIALQHWGSAAREAVKMPVKANWENPEASVSIGHCWSGVPACKSRALDCTGCKSRC